MKYNSSVDSALQQLINVSTLQLRRELRKPSTALKHAGQLTHGGANGNKGFTSEETRLMNYHI